MLVVGAGPAGAELSRGLAQAGIDVILIERLPRLDRAAFSSAALPLEAVHHYGLPAHVVASRWSGWQLIGPAQQRRQWEHGTPLGAVLDFGALRQWLVDQAQSWGARVQLATTALACRQVPGGVLTQVRRSDGRLQQVQSRWVVDASGQSRALLGEPGPGMGPLVGGIGLEWLLEVEPSCWRTWTGRLSFVLGSSWVSQGYGWVFPMQSGLLKVGVCRLMDPGSAQPALGPTMAQLLSRIGLDGGHVIDRHGGLIRSSLDRREPHRQGRLLGLGDAVSTANLLGGEGIRHALCSSRVLLTALLNVLKLEGLGQSESQQLVAIDRYPQLLRRELGWRWGLSGRLARRTWLGLSHPAADRRLERLLTGLETNRAEDLSALLFGYRFERYGPKALPYLLGWR